MTTIGKVNNIPVENNVLRRSYEVEWKISNFSALSDVTGIYYHSPIFSDDDIPWYLRIYPNGQSRNKSIGCIGLYLFLGESWVGLPISVEFSLGLKKLHGKKLSEHHYEYIFQNDGRGYGVRGCFCRSELFEEKCDFLPDDVLTVFCNFKYPKTVETSNEDSGSVVLYEKRVLQDYKEFYLKGEDCDVIIKVKGQEFPAHRAILQARSPVFASTYRHNTKEKTTGIIDIDDCEPFSFSDFLCFLYCGDRDIISVENVFSLFTAGDKYGVQDLMTQCVEFMKENLSVDTFCDTIALALLHSETELITLATDFFTKHALEIAKSVKWQSFSANNPTQSNELFIKALAAKGSNG